MPTSLYKKPSRAEFLVSRFQIVKNHFCEAVEIIVEFHETELWRELRYDSFTDFYEICLGLKKTRAYQMLSAGKLMRLYGNYELKSLEINTTPSTTVDSKESIAKPQNERQARKILTARKKAKLPPPESRTDEGAGEESPEALSGPLICSACGQPIPKQ